MIRPAPPGADLLKSDAQVLVNLVNTDGRMGAGLAKQFALAYPQMIGPYKAACTNGQLRPGGIWPWRMPDSDPPRYIVNMATKEMPENPSRYEWVESGTQALIKWCERIGITTVALAPPGAGLGRLDGKRVFEIVSAICKDSTVEVQWHGSFTQVAAQRTPPAASSAPPQRSSTQPQTTREFRGKQVISGPGFVLIKGLLSPEDIAQLEADAAAVKADRPLYRPTMRNGSPYRYDMTCAGPVKWLSDEQGYRYEKSVTAKGEAMWMPTSFKDVSSLALWVGGIKGKPQMQTVLINEYGADSRLGKHVDKDEKCNAPVISVSWGAACDFIFEDQTFRLEPGDVFVMHGPGRYGLHGVERIHGDRRTNLTARQVEPQEMEIEYRGSRLPTVAQILEEHQHTKGAATPTPTAGPDTRKIRLGNANAGFKNDHGPGTLLYELETTGSVARREFMYGVSRSKWVSEDLGIPWASALRNTFNVKDYGSAGATLPHFEDRAVKALNGDGEHAPAFRNQLSFLVEQAIKKGELIAVCHCAPGPCHTDVILSYVKAELERRGYSVEIESELEKRVNGFTAIAQAPGLQQKVAVR